MTLSDTSGVYGIFCKANGKVYIGGTTNLKRRRGQHFCGLAEGLHHCHDLQDLFEEYGEDRFVFKVIEEVPDDTHLKSLEQKWMDFYADLEMLLNECKRAGTTKGRAKTEEEKQRTSLGLIRYHASQIKETVNIADHIKAKGEDGLKDLSIRQLKLICSFLGVYRYSAMTKREMIKLISNHNNKDGLVEIVKEGQERKSRFVQRSKLAPEPYVVRRAAPFKGKEFWLISRDLEEIKVVGLDALVLALGSTYPLTLAFIKKKSMSLNGFYLLGIKDIDRGLFDSVSNLTFYTFQSPTLEEFNTINISKLSAEVGLGVKTLSRLKNGNCRTSLGWRYLGETNTLTGDFTPNPRLVEGAKRIA